MSFNAFMPVGSLSPNNKKQKSYEEIMASKGIKNKDNSMADFQKQMDNHTKLMCAMIKAQMPGEEVDPDKLTGPILQMMNTEQMMLMNQRTAESNDLQKARSRIDLAKFLGEEVNISTPEFTFEGDPIKLSYELPEYVHNPKCQIFSMNNLEIPVQELELDPNDMSGDMLWMGNLSNGQMAKNGGYVIKVVGDSKTEKDSRDLPLRINAETSIFVTLDALHTKKGGDPYFSAGHMAISSNDIQMVRHINQQKKNVQTRDQETDVEEINFTPSAAHEAYAQRDTVSQINEEV